MKYEFIIRKGKIMYAFPGIYKWIPDGETILSLKEINSMTGKQFSTFPKEFEIKN